MNGPNYSGPNYQGKMSHHGVQLLQWHKTSCALYEGNRKGDVVYFVLIHSVMCIQRGKSIHNTCDGVKFVTSKI